MYEAPIPIPGKTDKPIWEYPASALFYEWYEKERQLPEEQQSQAFHQFQALLKTGEAEPPRYLAHNRIQDLRHKPPTL